MPGAPGMRVGAVLGGFDTEGGYNGSGQPTHNWCWWEAEGRARRRPAAGGFWQRWDADVARVAAAGFDTVRVSVEWARCEPLDGQVDLDAIAAYCRLLDLCHEHRLQPVVTLHRFAHPAWMGIDLWLRPDAPERFCAWVETAVEHFAGRTHQWVTVDQLNACALLSYLSGRHPPGRRLDVGAAVRSLDHLLAAHVLAYEAIKDRQPQAVVAMGNRHLPVYELDALLIDLLLGRRVGVGRHDLHDWLTERRSLFAAASPSSGGAGLAWALRRWAGGAVPLDQAMARAVAAVYDSACDRSLDVLQLTAEPGDVFRVVPFPPSLGRIGPWHDAGGQLEAACRTGGETGLPLSVLGDAPADVGGLHRNRAAVDAAVAAGAPITAFHQRLTAAALRRLSEHGVAADEGAERRVVRRQQSVPGC